MRRSRRCRGSRPRLRWRGGCSAGARDRRWAGSARRCGCGPWCSRCPSLWPVGAAGRAGPPCGTEARARQTPAVIRADLDKQPRDVASMFDDVASRYDLTNDVLSLGQDRRWRSAVVEAVDPRPGERVLDLAAGTGTSSAPFADRGAFVVPCDFSLGMLAVGKQRRPELPFVAGDGLRLPFADATFDAVTVSFGLRNLHDTERGLRELLRVTRPGGRLVVCEFSHPTWAPFRTVYTEYLMRRAAVGGPRGVQQPRRVRLPGRVDPGLARPAGPVPRIASAGWGRSPGATCRGESWPCTAPPTLTRRTEVSRPHGGCGSPRRPRRGRSRWSGRVPRRRR